MAIIRDYLARERMSRERSSRSKRNSASRSRLGAETHFRPHSTFYVSLISVAPEHQVGDAPDVDFPDHTRKPIRRASIYG
jgi:hypothetical protein